jgi:protein-tyrosine phosphatase
MTEPVRVLFVCLGNICRSPTAHGVFLKRLEEAELSGLIQVDSCGTDGWHVGEAPDPRATEAAAQRGYDLSSLRARQFSPADFNHFDYVLAMDRNNLAVIEQAVFEGARCHPQLFLGYGSRSDTNEVPDPYYGGEHGFERVLDLVEDACDGLIRHIRERHF